MAVEVVVVEEIIDTKANGVGSYITKDLTYIVSSCLMKNKWYMMMIT